MDNEIFDQRVEEIKIVAGLPPIYCYKYPGYQNLGDWNPKEENFGSYQRRLSKSIKEYRQYIEWWHDWIGILEDRNGVMVEVIF